MAAKHVKQSITKREMDVLDILWKSETPLVASEIMKMNPELVMNTVQSVLRSLVKKGYVEVRGIEYSGTVLSRAYGPTELSVKQLMSDIHAQLQGAKSRMSVPDVYASLLEPEDDLEVIEALEAILQEKKDSLREER